MLDAYRLSCEAAEPSETNDQLGVTNWPRQDSSLVEDIPIFLPLLRFWKTEYLIPKLIK